jgi:hypothetical protein
MRHPRRMGEFQFGSDLLGVVRIWKLNLPDLGLVALAGVGKKLFSFQFDDTMASAIIYGEYS